MPVSDASTDMYWHDDGARWLWCARSSQRTRSSGYVPYSSFLLSTYACAARTVLRVLYEMPDTDIAECYHQALHNSNNGSKSARRRSTGGMTGGGREGGSGKAMEASVEVIAAEGLPGRGVASLLGSYAPATRCPVLT